MVFCSGKVKSITGQFAVQEWRNKDGQRPLFPQTLAKVDTPVFEIVLGDVLCLLIGRLVLNQNGHVVSKEATTEEGTDDGKHGDEIAQQSPTVNVSKDVKGNWQTVGEEGTETKAAQVGPNVRRVKEEGVQGTKGNLKEKTHVVLVVLVANTTGCRQGMGNYFRVPYKAGFRRGLTTENAMMVTAKYTSITAFAVVSSWGRIGLTDVTVMPPG